MKTETILVGDAGGTNVRFAQAHVDGDHVSVSSVWKRPGADYATFNDALAAFLAETQPRIVGAAFGLAGAVRDGRVHLLNRGWSVDQREIVDRLGVSDVVMVNDFFAMARGAAELTPDESPEIASGEADPSGSVAVGGPGTGFGIAVLRRIPDGFVVIAGEGGHQIFTPQTELEWRVAENLRAQGVYPSNEIVAAGAGFDETRAALAQAMDVRDPKSSQSEIIASAERGDAFALEFCRLRARCVMTSMGNLALSSNATGGVYLAGGVTQRLVPWLKEKGALNCFYQRGPRADLLSAIPIRLITSETAPLIGAAHLWLDNRNRGWL